MNHLRLMNIEAVVWRWRNGKESVLVPSCRYHYCETGNIIYNQISPGGTNGYDLKIMIVDGNLVEIIECNNGTTEKHILIESGSDIKKEVEIFKSELDIYCKNTFLYHKQYNGFEKINDSPVCPIIIFDIIQYKPFVNNHMDYIHRFRLSAKELNGLIAIDREKESIPTVKEFDERDQNRPFKLLGRKNSSTYFMHQSFCVNKGEERIKSTKFAMKNHIIQTKSTRKQVRNMLIHIEMLQEMGSDKYFSKFMHNKCKNARF